MKDHDPIEDWYSLNEAAKIIGIKPRTLKNRVYAKKNHPPVVRLSIWKFPKEDFHKWYSAKRSTS